MQTTLSRGLELFLCCFALHVLLWRRFPVHNHGNRLIILFFALPLALLSAFVTLAQPEESGLRATYWVEWLLSYVLHLGLSLGYLALYTSFTSFSPSIAILTRVDNSMPVGLPRDKLAPEWFLNENLSGLRCNNLIGAGLISQRDGVFYLRGRGKAIARTFLFYRRVLGLSGLAKG